MKTRRKILLIDDDPSVLHSLGEILSFKGYRVLKAQLAEDGLQIFEREKPSLVITDIMMPDMDGLEFLEKIQHMETEMESIIVTAYERTDLAIEALHLQATDFIPKPIRPQQLFSSIKRAEERLRHKRNIRQYIKRLEKMLDDRTQRLLQSEKQASIGLQVQGIIHNISTPLSVISSRAEYLAQKIQELLVKKELRENQLLTENLSKRLTEIQIILKNAQKIAQIISSIQEKSYKEQLTNLQPLDIKQLLEEELDFFQSDLYFKHNIETRFFPAPNLPKVCMIYSHLSQMLDNIIKNAIEAMYNSPVKKLNITTEENEQQIMIRIQDTGCGIAQKNLKKIFTPHFSTKLHQANNELGIPQGGSGLGLSTCMQLIKLYGGDILVKSTLHQGSEFTLVIPKSLNSDKPKPKSP